MKLYTKTGDDGTTGLFGGPRVAKDHPRIDAYGTVDELNAVLGMCIAACDEARPFEARLLEQLSQIQSRLFDLGADLATPPGGAHEFRVPRLATHHAESLERWIDEVDGGNDPIRAFVMPGGSELAARLHVARTVCRRAERLVVALARDDTVGPPVVIYLNRLSDLFFAMARRANKERGMADTPWVPGA